MSLHNPPPPGLEDLVRPLSSLSTTTTTSTCTSDQDVEAEARGPQLGDPSLSYLSPSSDFIRLPSSSKRPPRGVAVLNGDIRRQRSTQNQKQNQNRDKENQPQRSSKDDRRVGSEGEGEGDHKETAEGEDGDKRTASESESGRSRKAERILRFPRRRKSCVLTDGFVPLLQTDRLAIESIGKHSTPVLPERVTKLMG